jgi:hypothetical protein
MNKASLYTSFKNIDIAYTIPPSARARALPFGSQVAPFLSTLSAVLSMQEKDGEYANQTICAWPPQTQTQNTPNNNNSSNSSTPPPVRNCTQEYDVYTSDIAARLAVIRTAVQQANSSVADLLKIADTVRIDLNLMEEKMTTQLNDVVTQVGFVCLCVHVFVCI